jgi:hypothetical protein
VSTDKGVTWKSISKGIPNEPVNVIKEDIVNPNLLYVGTDHGLYISLDKGNSYMLMNNGLPAVAVHDVVVHPKTNDLIVGTHGRSIYLSNILPLQKMNAGEALMVFDMGPQRAPRRLGAKKTIWSPKESPTLPIRFYTENAGRVNLSIVNEAGTIYSNYISANKGVNVYKFDYSIGPAGISYLKDDEGNSMEAAEDGKYYLPAGKYMIKLQQASATAETNLELK